MKLLFLDINGVLNTKAYCHVHGWNSLNPYLVRQLISVCFYTDCRFVISSDWQHGGTRPVIDALEGRYTGDASIGFGMLLDLTSRIIGKTEDLGNRGIEIKEYVHRAGSSVERWCAVDDLELDLPEQNFVKVNPKRGLDWETSLRVIEKLNGPGYVS